MKTENAEKCTLQSERIWYPFSLEESLRKCVLYKYFRVQLIGDIAL